MLTTTRYQFEFVLKFLLQKEFKQVAGVFDGVFKFGDQARFFCNKGYDLIGDDTLTCTKNAEFDK